MFQVNNNFVDFKDNNNFVVFINFECFSHLVLVFLLLSLYW